jgi:hypothetical protein
MGVRQIRKAGTTDPFGILKIIFPNEPWCTGNGTFLAWREFHAASLIARGGRPRQTAPRTAGVTHRKRL